MSEPGKPPKKRGPPKGTHKGIRHGGRAKGTKNRATIERETKARIEAAERERAAQVGRLDAINVKTPEDALAIIEATPERLMKDIAFDFARLFAGMAQFYGPWPDWKLKGKKVINGNPNFNEAKWREYADLAAKTAIAAAPYQSPKLSAVMIGADVLNTIEIVGGLPDDQDGGLLPAESPTIGEDGEVATPAPPDLKVIGE
jgi:hypothetical protein